jgi:hypothetical protein
MGNLSNQYISQSFQSLLHLGSDNTASVTFAEIQDALGNGVGVFVNTAGNLKVTNHISASAISASTISGFGNPVIYSASVSDQLKALENITSSLINSTGSYATTGSNNFIGNQTITGDLDVSGQLRVTSIYTTQETSSIIFSSGSNILGDSILDTQTLNGLVRVSGSSQITGSMGISANLNVKGIMSASRVEGIGNVTDYSASIFNQLYTLNQTVDNYTSSINQLNDATASLYSSVYNLNLFTSSVSTDIAGIYAFTSSQNTKNSTLATYTASVNTKFTSVGISTSSLNAYTASSDTKWNTLQTTTASFSASLTNISALTSSYATTGSNTFVAKQTMNAGLFVPRNSTSSSINSVSSSLAINPIDIVITASTSSVAGQNGAVQIQGGSQNGVRIVGFMNMVNTGTGAPLFNAFTPVSQSRTNQYLLGFNNIVSVHSGSVAMNIADPDGIYRGKTITMTTPFMLGGVPSGPLAGNFISYYNTLGSGSVFINAETSIYNDLTVTGSIGISSTLKIAQSNPLPTAIDGTMAVSGSNLYFASASAWRKVTLG